MSARGRSKVKILERWQWFLVGLAILGTVAGAPQSLLLVLFVIPALIRYYRMRKYFDSEEFQAKKAEIRAFVDEHNDLKAYVDEIRDRGSFTLGESATGQYSHLAQSENTSRWNNRRDRNVASLDAPNVHLCSLQVVRKARVEPIKYLMKYFGIRPDEPSLERVEALGESVSSLEEAISNLGAREASVTEAIDPPAFIKRHYMEAFMDEVGIELSPIEIPYQTYAFEYTSAGGNSAERTSVTLDTPTIDALVTTLSERIRFRKSAAGQRALMTTKLRRDIKERDQYTCQTCGLGVHHEPHLLIEVDHIIPVSRGGMTTEENLQALCWKCNRSKSNKMPVA